MQAGTTGINAMRVYNVTKQGKDQDPDGIFIRKYVAELQNVPNEYIHEPNYMPLKMQKKYGVLIGNAVDKVSKAQSIINKNETSTNGSVYYPAPILDEKASARAAKDRLSTVRKQENTKLEAEQVYLKHGSRRSRDVGDRDGMKPKALSSSVKRVRIDRGQMSLMKSWISLPQEQSESKHENEVVDEHEESHEAKLIDNKKEPTSLEELSSNTQISLVASNASNSLKKNPSITSFLKEKDVSDKSPSIGKGWNCKTCTFLNEKPLALVCSMCRSVRQS